VKLVVVESPAKAKTIEKYLGAGYRVLAPETPREAIALCRDPLVKIDMLVTDVVLPETDGVDVARQAVAERPRLRVLFMSGYTEHRVLRLPRFDHAAPFLQKPFSKASLLAKVNEVLNTL